MKINKKIIQKLNLCKDRFNNFTTNYPDFNSNLEDFILLENITYQDKVWVFTRLATKEQNVKWALLCASKVLSIFEDKYPNDKRPRQALEAAEAWLKNPTSATARATARAADAARDAARAVAYDDDDNAYYATARAADAAYTATYTDSAARAVASATVNAAYAAAYTATHLIRTDARAAASAAVNAATYNTARATARATARNIEEEVNLMFMVEAIK